MVDRIAILTSGGDAPGMNAAIRGVTLIARSMGIDVLGVQDGYDGLMSGRWQPLEPDDVGGIQRQGGTFLGSARSERFRTEVGRAEALHRLSDAGVDALIVIGGNGSLTGLARLLEEAGSGLRGIGIPASIDNDLGLTRLCIGVDTAVNTIVQACDNLMDTAGSHRRVFIVEVMGRHCGYLAMAASVAAGAHGVLFPEAHKSTDDLVETVMRAVRKADRRSRTRRRALILKAEGVDIPLSELQARVAERIAAEDVHMDVRVTVLGHVVRGGSPSALDRMIGTRLGHAAVRGLMEGQSRKMASWCSPEELGLSEPDVLPTPGDPRTSLVNLDAVLQETEAMLQGTSPFIAWRSRVMAQLEDALSS